jgi:transposase
MGTKGSSGGRRNRSWPEALKREIVAATYAPGSSVSTVARQYDVNANQLFIWRKRFRDDQRQPCEAPIPQLIPVTIAGEKNAIPARPSAVCESFEIEVAGKYRIHMGSGFDGFALRRVLDVLERR